MSETILKLVSLLVLAVLCNGPWSPVVPTGTEPLVVVYGRMLPPPLVAAIAALGALLIEPANWRLYGAALASRRMAGVRGSRVAALVTRHFARAPFATTLACSIVPVPFWLARCTAILSRYPRRRFLAAMVIGRFAFWWLCAALGSIAPAGLVWIVAGIVVLAGIWALGAWIRLPSARRQALFAGTEVPSRLERR